MGRQLNKHLPASPNLGGSIMQDIKERVDSWLYDFGVDDNWKPQLLEEAKILFAELQEREAKLVNSLESIVNYHDKNNDVHSELVVDAKSTLQSLGIEDEIELISF